MRRHLAITWSAACIGGLALAAAAPPSPSPSPDPRPFRTALAQDPEPLGVGRIVPDLPFTDLDGNTQPLSEALRGRRALAICMTSATCPLSIKYGPRLTQLAEEYEPRAVRFVLMNVADTDSQADMRRQARSLRWPAAYLPDARRELRRALAPRTTTEVVVIDAGRTVIYRGAVDDQHGIGSSLAAPRNTFLRDALDAALRGRAPAHAATWPPGCVIAPSPGPAAPPAEVTYHNRISRIVQARCLDCHSQERAAPFPLASYESIVGRAPMIEAVVREGIMPPWHAAPPAAGGPSPWSNDRALTASEKEDLLAWLRAGHPIGDPADAPVEREFPPGWLLGMPDQLFITPPLEVPAEGPMAYSALRIETGLCEDTWVSAVELLPRMRDSIHHALVYIVPPSSDSAAPQDPTRNLLAVYGPGYSTVEFPPSAAAMIPAGSALLVHAYSIPMGTPHRASLRIGLRLAKEPPPLEVRTAAITAPDLLIPAGAAQHEVTAATTLTQNTTVTAFMPTMRSRGRSIRYDALLPDGTELPLLNIPRYDFKWRPRYALAEPIELPAGSRLRCSATFDNSAANPSNPDPAAEVRSGWTPADDILLAAYEHHTPAAPTPPPAPSHTPEQTP